MKRRIYRAMAGLLLRLPNRVICKSPRIWALVMFTAVRGEPELWALIRYQQLRSKT